MYRSVSLRSMNEKAFIQLQEEILHSWKLALGRGYCPRIKYATISSGDKAVVGFCPDDTTVYYIPKEYLILDPVAMNGGKADEDASVKDLYSSARGSEYRETGKRQHYGPGKAYVEFQSCDDRSVKKMLNSTLLGKFPRCDSDISFVGIDNPEKQKSMPLLVVDANYGVIGAIFPVVNEKSK